LKIKIDRNLGPSIVRQIYQAISDKIMSDLLPNGSKLPSIRSLAKDLDISLMTVVAAYNLLEEDRYIIQKHGKGSFVHRASSNQSKIEDKHLWQHSYHDYLPRAPFSNNLIQYKHVIPLSISTIYPGLYPNKFIENQLRKVTENDPRILTTYGDIQGDLELRKEYTSYLKQFGIITEPNQVLVVNGSQQAIDLVARTFVGPGDYVIMEGPTYPAAIDVFRARGASVLQVPLDDEGIRVDILEELVEKYNPKLIYLVPNLHNPTGIITSNLRKKIILEIVSDKNCMILEDDPWSELYFDTLPQPLTSLKSMDKKGKVIYIKGSKVLVPGCRIGVLVAEGSIFQKILSAKGYSDLGSPLLSQKILQSVLSSEHLNQYLEKLRIALSIRKDYLLEKLTNSNIPSISWTKPNGGINIWVTLPEWVDTEALLQTAILEGVSFLPSAYFFANEPIRNQLRISFASVDELSLKLGTEKLIHCLKRI
jgi:DNA-binding transcriptional MocR family regulator